MNRLLSPAIGYMLIAVFATYPNFVYGQTAESKKSARPPFKVERSIEGQVFIVTKDRSNIKLALVNVAAYPESDLNSKLSRPLKEARSEFERYQKVKSRNADLKAEMESMQGPLNRETYGSTKYLELHTRYVQVSEDWANTLVELETLKNALSLTTPRRYIDRLSGPIAVSRTDVDGVFKLNLAAGAYVLVATGDRQVSSNSENYEWLVKVNLSKSSQKVILSNHNLVSTKCDECVNIDY